MELGVRGSEVGGSGVWGRVLGFGGLGLGVGVKGWELGAWSVGFGV